MSPASFVNAASPDPPAALAGCGAPHPAAAMSAMMIAAEKPDEPGVRAITIMLTDPGNRPARGKIAGDGRSRIRKPLTDERCGRGLRRATAPGDDCLEGACAYHRCHRRIAAAVPRPAG